MCERGTASRRGLWSRAAASRSPTQRRGGGQSIICMPSFAPIFHPLSKNTLHSDSPVDGSCLRYAGMAREVLHLMSIPQRKDQPIVSGLEANHLRRRLYLPSILQQPAWAFHEHARRTTCPCSHHWAGVGAAGSWEGLRNSDC